MINVIQDFQADAAWIEVERPAPQPVAILAVWLFVTASILPALTSGAWLGSWSGIHLPRNTSMSPFWSDWKVTATERTVMLGCSQGPPESGSRSASWP